jgi:hypothetical protein
MALATGDQLRPSSTLTVADAVASYIQYLKMHRRTGHDAEKRAAKLILPALAQQPAQDGHDLLAARRLAGRSTAVMKRAVLVALACS